jgi:hypothetical protein
MFLKELTGITCAINTVLLNFNSCLVRFAAPPKKDTELDLLRFPSLKVQFDVILNRQFFILNKPSSPLNSKEYIDTEDLQNMTS